MDMNMDMNWMVIYDKEIFIFSIVGCQGYSA